MVTLGPKVIKFIPLLSGRTRRGNSAFSHLEVVAFLLFREKKGTRGSFLYFYVIAPLVDDDLVGKFIREKQLQSSTKLANGKFLIKTLYAKKI